MFFHIHGTNTKTTALLQATLLCPACEKETEVDLLVLSHYFHLFFIPCFPTELDLVTFCKTCGLKRTGVPREKFQLSANYEIITRLKHPWFSYIGTTLFILPFVLGILLYIFDQLEMSR